MAKFNLPTQMFDQVNIKSSADAAGNFARGSELRKRAAYKKMADAMNNIPDGKDDLRKQLADETAKLELLKDELDSFYVARTASEEMKGYDEAATKSNEIKLSEDMYKDYDPTKVMNNATGKRQIEPEAPVVNNILYDVLAENQSDAMKKSKYDNYKPGYRSTYKGGLY